MHKFLSCVVLAAAILQNNHTLTISWQTAEETLRTATVIATTNSETSINSWDQVERQHPMNETQLHQPRPTYRQPIKKSKKQWSIRTHKLQELQSEMQVYDRNSWKGEELKEQTIGREENVQSESALDRLLHNYHGATFMCSPMRCLAGKMNSQRVVWTTMCVCCGWGSPTVALFRQHIMCVETKWTVRGRVPIPKVSHPSKHKGV